MDFGGKFVDISPWMLVEATGDSEFDSSAAAGASCTSVSPGCSEDDALSCSCDDNVNRGEDFEDSYVSEQDKRRNIDGDGYDDRDGEEDEDEEGAVDQVRDGGGGGWRGLEECWREEEAVRRRRPEGAVEVVVMNMMGLGRRKKRKSCREPLPVPKSQRDADRHFWEACLSS